MEGMGGGVAKVEISTPALSPDTLAPFSPQTGRLQGKKKCQWVSWVLSRVRRLQRREDGMEQGN